MSVTRSVSAKRTWADPAIRARRLAWWKDEEKVAIRNAAISAALTGKTCPALSARNRLSRGTKWTDNMRLTHQKTEEQRAKISAALRGRRLSEAHRQRIGRGLRRHMKTHSVDCPCLKTRGKNQRSRLGERMIAAFLGEFPVVQAEERFGKYTVDAYLPPPYHLAFEADGHYWHSFPDRIEYDRKRDAALLRNYGLPVVRLSEGEINAVSAQKEAQ